jgi:hypothetical protein
MSLSLLRSIFVILKFVAAIIFVNLGQRNEKIKL